MFDWIPTIPEVFAKVECTLGGHSWKVLTHKGDDNFNGRRYRVCQNCEKAEWIS